MDRPNKIRVLLVDLSLKFGGADVRVMQLASLLSDRFDARVAVLKGSETEDRFISAGLSVVSIATSRRDPRTVLRLMTVMRHQSPSVIDLHNAQSQLWGMIAGSLLRVPARIATFHSVYEESERRGRSMGLYRRLIGLIRRTGTHFVSVSEPVDAYLADHRIPASRRAVIHNGIETAVGPTNRKPPTSDPRRTLVIACIGRLVPVKGQEFLLHALSRIRDEKGAWVCNIVGDGPERASLQSLADRLRIGNRVNFLGYRTDVADILGNTDLVCMPSLSEGLPYTLFEAAAVELPIIASAVGGIAKHFHHRDTIYLVDAGNIDQLQTAIEWSMEFPDEASAMGRRAQAFVAERFTAARMVRQTEDFYLASLPAAAE